MQYLIRRIILKLLNKKRTIDNEDRIDEIDGDLEMNSFKSEDKEDKRLLIAGGILELRRVIKNAYGKITKSGRGKKELNIPREPSTSGGRGMFC